jgi:hypothetical protein
MIIDSPIVSGSLLLTGSLTHIGDAAHTGSFNLSGSLSTTGTITATTLVVQTITSSISSITGSTKFGSLSTNTHQFTGSVNITGSSHSIIGNTTITSGPGSTLLLVKTSNNIPAITFTGATYSAAIDGGDYLGFSTSGSNYKMYINASGSVGIGTTTPEGVLTIKGISAQPPTSGTTANSLLQLVGSLGAELNIGSNTVTGGYGSYIQASDNNLAVPYPLNLQPNGGNVGIGESSPASPLSVTATSTAAAVSTGVAYIVNNGTGNGLQVTTSGTAGTSFIFKARSSGVDRFWVGDTGNVGIGTPSPGQTLDVRGNIALGPTATAVLHAEVNTVSTTTIQVASNNGIGVGAFYFVVWYNTTGGAQGIAMLMARSGTLTTISISDGSGCGVGFSISGATLRAQTTSGTVSMAVTQINM